MKNFYSWIIHLSRKFSITMNNSMNKIISKEIFIKNKILTPSYFSLNKKKFIKKILKSLFKKEKINFPVVIKPSNEGSSLGVKISQNYDQLFRFTKSLFKTYNELKISNLFLKTLLNAPVITVVLSLILFLI